PGLDLPHLLVAGAVLVGELGQFLAAGLVECEPQVEELLLQPVGEIHGRLPGGSRATCECFCPMLGLPTIDSGWDSRRVVRPGSLTGPNKTLPSAADHARTKGFC